jgi:hypothetical protein
LLFLLAVLGRGLLHGWHCTLGAVHGARGELLPVENELVRRVPVPCGQLLHWRDRRRRAMPRWQVWFCCHGDVLGLLGRVCSRFLLSPRLRVRQRRDRRGHMHDVPEDVFGGVLVPRGRDDSNWRRDGWRLSYRIIQYCGWCYINDICVHAVPRGDLWLCYDADDCSVLGQLHSRVLLPLRIRVRQRRNQRGRMHHVPQDVLCGILLSLWIRVR